jgi:hypothetical protein
MSRKRNPQLAPAAALVQLLQEHPELPAASSWSVEEDRLIGHLHAREAADYARLYAYADVIGGEIRRRLEFETVGGAHRSLVMAARWRDVLVEMHLLVPAVVDEAVCEAGRVAEQRHQLVDPAVPVAPGACRVAGLGRAA